MKRFKEFLIIEGKQVGTLYHYTTFENGDEILRSNRLHDHYGISGGKVSFTRNKNLHKNPDISVGMDMSFEFSGDDISNNRKIKPFHDSKYFVGSRHRRNKENSEAEERIDGPLEGISNRIKTIRIHSLPLFKDDPEYLENIKKRAKELGIPIKEE
jgi:hypothetical protein